MSDLLLNAENFGEKIYNRFPVKYRDDDLKNEIALYRYITAIGDSAFKDTIQNINGLLNLLDTSLLPDTFLPVILRHYGLNVDGIEDVPSKYLRHLLNGLPTAVRYRGNVGAIKYLLMCMLTDTEIAEEDITVTAPTDVTGGYLIEFNTHTEEETAEMQDFIFTRGVSNIINSFVPFFNYISFEVSNSYVSNVELSVTEEYSITNAVIEDSTSVIFDGTNYIEMPYSVSDDMYLEIEFTLTQKDGFLFGCRTSNTDNNSYAFAFYVGSAVVYPQFGTFRNSISCSLALNTTYKVILSANGCYVDGTLIKSFTENSFTGGSLYIGALNQNDVPTRSFQGTVSSVIYKSVSDNIPVEYTPCKMTDMESSEIINYGLRNGDNVYSCKPIQEQS